MPGMLPSFKPDMDLVDAETLASMPVFLKIADAWRKYWISRGTTMCDNYSQTHKRRCVRRKYHQGTKHQYSDLTEKVEW